MSRTGSRIPPVGGLTWEDVKSKLETETDYKIKPYDDDLDGALDWKALRFPGVRQSVLAEFTDPRILIATSSMLEVCNSADKVEHAAGNISATSKELTIVGGTSSEAGDSWIYWNLPNPATKVYVHAFMACEDGGDFAIEFCDGDGSTLANPPDRFYILLNIAWSTKDFQLWKAVGDTATDIASEAVDLTSLEYYEVEAYFDGDGEGNWAIKVWRDGVLKFDLTHSEAEIPSIHSIRFRKHDPSTSAAIKGLIKGHVVIIYE